MLVWRFLIRPSIRNTNLRRPVDSDAADSLFDKLMGRPNGRPLKLLTKCGVQGDHPPAGVWGRAPKPYAAACFASVASARRAQETRLSPKSGVFQRSEGPSIRTAPQTADKRAAFFGKQPLNA